MTATFKPAERIQTNLKLAILGPSGSGKSFSALSIASGMGDKIAVVDTENGSANLYADRFKFDVLTIAPPYTIQKYVDAIKAAQSAAYDVVIFDSLSHAWMGEGGLLAKKEALDSRGGNSYTNWSSITKEHEQLKAAILNAKIHMICTMRSKQDYVLELNEKGKSVPKKVGMAPQQRDGLEFEFALVFDMGMDHHAQISKDRTSLFDGQIFKPTKETGELLMQWLKSAKPVQNTSEPIKTSGVHCHTCQAEVVLHSSGTGYLCPNSKQKGDEHLRFLNADLEKYLALNQENLACAQ